MKRLCLLPGLLSSAATGETPAAASKLDVAMATSPGPLVSCGCLMLPDEYVNVRWKNKASTYRCKGAWARDRGAKAPVQWRRARGSGRAPHRPRRSPRPSRRPAPPLEPPSTSWP